MVTGVTKLVTKKKNQSSRFWKRMKNYNNVGLIKQI